MSYDAVASRCLIGLRPVVLYVVRCPRSAMTGGGSNTRKPPRSRDGSGGRGWLFRSPIRGRVASRERLTAPFIDEVREVGAVAGDDPGSPCEGGDSASLTARH